MLADVPCPEFDHMAAWVGYVCGTPATMAVPGVIMVEDRVASLSEPLDDRLVGLRRQPHRVVNVDANSGSPQSDLGPPETDPSSVCGHHPNRFVAPALNHRKAQNAGIEFLGRGQVVLLERDLAHSSHGNCPIAHHHISSVAFGPRRLTA